MSGTTAQAGGCLPGLVRDKLTWIGRKEIQKHNHTFENGLGGDGTVDFQPVPSPIGDGTV